ncbi:MAG: PadR family transcriptional regulator, partial [Candidatus Hermodarchaeota archaeon]
MVEELANKFEKAIKKGFTSILILSVLENGPSYGYKIGKEIEELTYSIWEPPASTMYTLLKQLSGQGLIRAKEIDSEERGKKIYEITQKGCETLNLMRKKQLKIRNALQSFLISTIGSEDLSNFKEFVETPINQQISSKNKISSKKLQATPFDGPFDMVFHKNNNITDVEKIDYLKQKKIHLLKHKEIIKREIKQIEKA